MEFDEGFGREVRMAAADRELAAGLAFFRGSEEMSTLEVRTMYLGLNYNRLDRHLDLLQCSCRDNIRQTH